ncbi:hypothetical protein LTR56_007600 [Elasticomyces elasticus]|nr:hypothetical protein LTR56_007600 [Elasticomyces elasticus]KAK3665301.1 hypothetical protein LTR22_003823 [Elasticomyces elasticus]KAK4929726.1 hypothetical protein LTR49_003684 [Elasticomyces elasticus]KAK5761054.1 hypothetical protein LTS12_008731 [Elasticomyces elasticus]
MVVTRGQQNGLEPANKDRSTRLRSGIPGGRENTKITKALKKRVVKKRTDVLVPHATPTEHSPFLGLPAELRNQIYAFSAQESSAVLIHYARGRLISNSPLMGVNRQVRNEYTSVLYLSAPLITAHVRNFSFDNIVTFLNRLSDHELAALPSQQVPSERQILAKLHIDGPALVERLDRWLNRCEHPTKKGTSITVSYVVHGDEGEGLPSWARRDMTTVRGVYFTQLRALNRMERSKMNDGRVYEELKKITEALLVPQPPVPGMWERKRKSPEGTSADLDSPEADMTGL